VSEASIEHTNAFADGFYGGIQIVADYMKSRSELLNCVLDRPATGYRDACLKGLFMRARAWMYSLEKLNQVRHIQAISVANRALLEITVDMLLLHHDKTNESGNRMYWWGQSERMRAAEMLVDYYTELGLPVPDEYKPLETAYRSDKATVDQMRISLWPYSKDPTKPRHPDRWTGRANLFEDIKVVDQLFGPSIKSDLGATLTQYYRTEYRKMNWQIHSGIAGFWSIPLTGMYIICGFAFKWCADFGMLCTKTILTDFGFDLALDELKQEWEDVKIKRGLAYLEKRPDTS
jgi:hypothetical protein